MQIQSTTGEIRSDYREEFNSQTASIVNYLRHSSNPGTCRGQNSSFCGEASGKDRLYSHLKRANKNQTDIYLFQVPQESVFYFTVTRILQEK